MCCSNSGVKKLLSQIIFLSLLILIIAQSPQILTSKNKLYAFIFKVKKMLIIAKTEKSFLRNLKFKLYTQPNYWKFDYINT